MNRKGSNKVTKLIFTDGYFIYSFPNVCMVFI